MQRGEVWWVEFPRPTGRRPILLISRKRGLRHQNRNYGCPNNKDHPQHTVEVGLGEQKMG